MFKIFAEVFFFFLVVSKKLQRNNLWNKNQMRVIGIVRAVLRIFFRQLSFYPNFKWNGLVSSTTNKKNLEMSAFKTSAWSVFSSPLALSVLWTCSNENFIQPEDINILFFESEVLISFYIFLLVWYFCFQRAKAVNDAKLKNMEISIT